MATASWACACRGSPSPRFRPTMRMRSRRSRREPRALFAIGMGGPSRTRVAPSFASPRRWKPGAITSPGRSRARRQAAQRRDGRGRSRHRRRRERGRRAAHLCGPRDPDGPHPGERGPLGLHHPGADRGRGSDLGLQRGFRLGLSTSLVASDAQHHMYSSDPFARAGGQEATIVDQTARLAIEPGWYVEQRTAPCSILRRVFREQGPMLPRHNQRSEAVACNDNGPSARLWLGSQQIRTLLAWQPDYVIDCAAMLQLVLPIMTWSLPSV